jgi:hypothetical protein
MKFDVSKNLICVFQTLEEYTMKRKWGNANFGKRARRMAAAAIAFTFLFQNFAWAVCADGTTFPAGGFVAGQAPTAHWSPNIFTFTRGSIFVPDTSVFEHNDPTQPVTGGGHNWVVQGLVICKMIDAGPAGGTPTAWAFPSFIGADSAGCAELTPTINGSLVVDTPLPGQAITPTCNPALLSQPGAPNPANTYFNQLGCAISHGVATTPQTATTFLFAVGTDNTFANLFMVALTNVANPVVGGAAGKIFSSEAWYSGIPNQGLLTNAAVSPDGMFAIASSNKKSPNVYACLNPLGDPGDPSQPINPNFSVPAGNASQVLCMQVVNDNLSVDSTTAFGPDNQPYFGGQPGVNSVNSVPGGSAATAWPQCIFNNFGFSNPAPTTLMGKLQAVFTAHSANHCGNAQANIGFMQALIAQPLAIISHGSYMYASTGSNSMVQLKVTVDPVSGLSNYAFRTYVSGLSGFGIVTGLGVADDLKSLMTFSDPTGFGILDEEVIIKVPLCEDM